MRNRGTGWLIGIAAVAIIGAAGCNRDRTETAQSTTASEPAPATETRSDGWITTTLQARFFADPDVRGRHIDVTTNGGVVTLRGTVESEEERRQAVTLAESIEGVTRVDDQLRLETVAQRGAGEMRADDRARDAVADTARETGDNVNAGWITTKIQAQYFASGDVSPWRIDVTTMSDGLVVLNGEVDDEASRQEAVRIAQNTDGVTRVEDNLRIRPASTEAADASGVQRGASADRDYDVPGGDAWVTAKIQSKYFLDDEVKGHDINVDTRDGVVTLRGHVATEAQHRQAVALARSTDGVRDVRDELRVQPEGDTDRTADARSTARDTAQKVDDGWITTKIQSKYFLDGDVKGHQIDVDTRNGVVTLTGHVESDEARSLAESIARETDGVRQVVNRLAVTPDNSASR
jgi:osmotically-inducible protein OsmY